MTVPKAGETFTHIYILYKHTVWHILEERTDLMVGFDRANQWCQGNYFSVGLDWSHVWLWLYLAVAAWHCCWVTLKHFTLNHFSYSSSHILYVRQWVHSNSVTNVTVTSSKFYCYHSHSATLIPSRERRQTAIHPRIVAQSASDVPHSPASLSTASRAWVGRDSQLHNSNTGSLWKYPT